MSSCRKSAIEIAVGRSATCSRCSNPFEPAVPRLTWAANSPSEASRSTWQEKYHHVHVAGDYAALEFRCMGQPLEEAFKLRQEVRDNLRPCHDRPAGRNPSTSIEVSKCKYSSEAPPTTPDSTNRNCT